MKKIVVLHVMLIFSSSAHAMERPLKRKYCPDATDALKILLNRQYCSQAELPSERIKKLIYAGADPNVAPDYEPGKGLSALLRAVELNIPNLALFLLEHGANPNSVFAGSAFPEGMSVLHYAIKTSAAFYSLPSSNPISKQALHEIIIGLIKHEADVNEKNKLGSPILNTALIAGVDPTYIELLLSEGALPDVRDSRGCTALDLARRWRGNPESIQLLEERQKTRLK